MGLKDFETSLGLTLSGEFDETERLREPYVEEWLKDLRQYKGQYEQEVIDNIDEMRSTVNIRQTKIKIDSMVAKCMDLLFPATGELNWGIDHTPEPDIAPEVEERLREILLQKKPDATEDDFRTAVREYAKKCAERMTDEIKDQLAEKPGKISYREKARRVIKSGLMFGTGILKGPLVAKKQKKVWRLSQDENGTPKWGMENVESGITPYYEVVPIWNYYPDMAVGDHTDCSFEWQTHLKNQAGLLELAERGDFKGDIIREYIRENLEGDAELKNHEQQLRSMSEDADNSSTLKGWFRLKERWGYITGSDLIEHGVDVPDGDELAVFYSNVWILGQYVIKSVLAPVKGSESPYHNFYFDKDETSIFADGLPRILRDPVKAYNAATRGMLDHAAITAGPQISYNASALAQGIDLDIYPFKLWGFENAEDMTKAFHVWDLSNHMSEYVALTQHFRDIIDELSVPRFMHGDNDVKGAGETAHGLSMLMGAANINLKEIIKIYDDNITQPFITSMYNWNMQFNEREDIKGDFDIVAKGSSSLIAKEIMADKLMKAIAITDSPRFNGRAKDDDLLHELFKALEVSSDLVRTDEEYEEWKRQQMVMQAEANIEAMLIQAEKRGLDPNAILQAAIIQNMSAMQGANGSQMSGMQPAAF